MSDNAASPSGRSATADSLAGSDELVRLLLDSTGEGIYGVDLEGKCTFANPACLRLLGFEKDTDLLGRNMHELVHHTRPNGEPYPEKECRIYKAFREHAGTHVDDEVMFRKDGSSFSAEYWSHPVEREGELLGCVVTFMDISERRRSEQLLAEQAATIAEVARFPEMNPGPVVRLDLDGNVLMANAAAEEVFGADLVGTCWLDICPDIDGDVWNEIVDSTGPCVLERRIQDRDYVLTHRRDFEGDLVFVFGADITEQREAQRALRQADELVRLLLNSTGEGIYGVDLEGNCTFANPACARLLGYESVDELLGKHMHDLVHHTRPNGEPYPVEECRIYQAFREHKGTHVDDEVMFCSDGKPFPAEYWSYPVERDGELVGCVVTFVDISDRRRVEEELRQREKMAALGKLSAGLAHELNNPAAAAGRAAGQLVEMLDELLSATVRLARTGLGSDGWAQLSDRYTEFGRRSDQALGLSALEASDREDELLSWLEGHGVEEPWEIASTLASAGVRDEDLEEIAGALPADGLAEAIDWLDKALDARELAGTVVRSSRTMSELVSAVKSYTHMDRAPVDYVDVHAGLEDTIRILGHKLKKGIEVVRRYDRDLPRARSGGSDLNQVWTNLIDNAIGALGDRGTITIQTRRDGDHIVVEVIDDGPGIPQEIQNRIFEPFFTTKEVGQGTGLGLDIVRRIVGGRCGGSVDFSSRPGETVFRVRLPVDEAATCEQPADAEPTA
ncbi:MAG: PAS domain S-box protein [Gemmatimonadetes bacterium]|uniref:histidine kinase n=1 Tax=Candidatus Kutchimonas denitrificans TaxID=3056748 RepID=A0AAE4ZAS1_9BACT|nr:PAS domain S-box protein [Gemmatimonadota bacterium]NIR75336.1 PAS domain S-box protein [Candidatus Kutchimonas denitrificans]NIS00968.1 PAS domain S-box protein [Gemmatimonadota bacterium]NIT66595.1 PAS domain S-box protein [Gemmatimonadota bacterium]NIU53165.1 PAS domain S-box protein [Gemmatimonadota bacterium]